MGSLDTSSSATEVSSREIRALFMSDEVVYVTDKRPEVVIGIHTRICLQISFVIRDQPRALLSTAGRHAGAPERWFSDATSTNVTNDLLTQGSRFLRRAG